MVICIKMILRKAKYYANRRSDNVYMAGWLDVDLFDLLKTMSDRVHAILFFRCTCFSFTEYLSLQIVKLKSHLKVM